MSVTRPRVLREIEILARIHTEAAIKTLAEIMGDREAPHGARVQAANSLLDRGWGRTPQTVVVEDSPQYMTDEDLERHISDKITELAAGAANRARETGSEARGDAAGDAAAKGAVKSPRVVH